MLKQTTYPLRQRGAVLITSLMFMVVLTLVALMANQSTVLEARMSTNTIVKQRATESSEALRTGINDLLQGHFYSDDWPTSLGGTLPDSLFSIPSGIGIYNTGLWGVENSAGENLYDSSTWVQDVSLRVDGNNDGDYVDEQDQQADLMVFRIGSENATGSATAQGAGYLGLGKGTRGGGSVVFFELRSVGSSAGSSSTVTGSTYRYRPQ
jgi:hypothetical protein